MTKQLPSSTNEKITIHCEGFSLPESALLSKESRRVLQQQVTDQKAAAAITSKEPISDTPPTREDVREQLAPMSLGVFGIILYYTLHKKHHQKISN